MNGFFNRFSAFDYVIMAMMAAIGVAVKPFVSAFAHIITGPFMIPGGTVAGGIYMLFLVLGAAIVGKRGAATLIAAVEALLVIATGIMGSHGIVSFVTYLLPGIGVDILWLLMRHKGCCALCCFFGGIVANILGCFTVNLVFFRLPFIPLIIMLSAAAISGGIGGIIAYNINKILQKYGLVQHEKHKSRKKSLAGAEKQPITQTVNENKK